MDTQSLVAALLGWVAGFVTSIPGGPINATLMAEGPRRGFRWCVFLALGAVLMESVYCGIAFAGFSSFFNSHWIHAAIELVSFLLMLWLGTKYLRGAPIPGQHRVEHFVEETFHPHTAFWTGFLRVLGNPGLLLLWLTVIATLLSRDWISYRWGSKWPFIAGVAGGGMVWFSLVGWGVSRGRGRLSPRALARLSQASGILLLLVAAVVGYRLVELLARGRTPGP